MHTSCGTSLAVTPEPSVLSAVCYRLQVAVEVPADSDADTDRDDMGMKRWAC